MHVDPTPPNLDPFCSQASSLLAELGTSLSKCETPIRAHYPVPRQGNSPTRFAQDAANKAGTSWQSGAGCDFAVAGDATIRNCQDHVANSVMLDIERFFH